MTRKNEETIDSITISIYDANLAFKIIQGEDVIVITPEEAARLSDYFYRHVKVDTVYSIQAD